MQQKDLNQGRIGTHQSRVTAVSYYSTESLLCLSLKYISDIFSLSPVRSRVGTRIWLWPWRLPTICWIITSHWIPRAYHPWNQQGQLSIIIAGMFSVNECSFLLTKTVAFYTFRTRHQMYFNRYLESHNVTTHVIEPGGVCTYNGTLDDKGRIPDTLKSHEWHCPKCERKPILISTHSFNIFFRLLTIYSFYRLIK